MPWRIVSALSITHLVSYGTLFYAFALLIEPMERDLEHIKAIFAELDRYRDVPFMEEGREQPPMPPPDDVSFD